MDLRPSEIRVLGCLLEKQRTTPDLYPLTLNSLRLACNQSTNREPVVSYEDAEVKDALHRLERRGLTRFAGGAGSRAPKYRHLLAEVLPMDDAEQAVMCVMMLRGPQTPGELKQRCERMHAFPELAAVHETLERLMGRDLAVRLPRRPGQKEERYAHMLGGEETEQAPARPAETSVSGVSGAAPVSEVSGGMPVSGASGGIPGSEPAGGTAVSGVSEASPWQQSNGGSHRDVTAAEAHRDVAEANLAPAALREEVERLSARVATLEIELRELQDQLGVGRT